MLYKNNAPITKENWVDLEIEASRVFQNYLSARKVLHVNGPKGIDFNSVYEGRLNKVNSLNDIEFSTYKVQPLTEVRACFTLNRYELDNLSRGAKGIDYRPMEKAAKEIAFFEENSIFYGLKEGNITGLLGSSFHETINLEPNAISIMHGISKAMVILKKHFESRPYALIAGDKLYKEIIFLNSDCPLDSRIDKLIGGPIVYNHVIEGGLLVPYNHEDLELTIGQDLSIGYNSHTNETIDFFFTESFTFRILDNSIIIDFNVL